MLRRLALLTVCIALITVPILGQYSYYAYADSSGEWVNVSNDEQYQAFLAYCKSRKITIGGSVVDAATVVTTELYQNAVSTLGIDVNSLQTSLWKYQENNTTVKWGFQYFGITAFNSILGQILQNYNIDVGDENVDVTVKSGKWFQDLDGNGCYVFVSSAVSASNTRYQGTGESIDAYGTYYVLSPEFISSLDSNYTTSNIRITAVMNSTISLTNNPTGSGNSYRSQISLMFPGLSNSHYIIVFSKYINTGVVRYSGFPCIIYNPTLNELYVGGYNYWSNGTKTLQYFATIVNGGATDTVVKITSPKVEPPLDPPEGDDITTILPDGTIEEPEPEPGGDIPDWELPDSNVTPDGDGGFNFDWNFQLPDLNIDWSINGLSNKFPFCIPKDIVNIVSVLNQEPVAPHFTGTVDLFIYDWSVDIDFSDFSTIAVIFRNGIFIVFCIGLIVITRNIIRG
jgi:hypothetical protein